VKDVIEALGVRVWGLRGREVKLRGREAPSIEDGVAGGAEGGEVVGGIEGGCGGAGVRGEPGIGDEAVGGDDVVGEGIGEHVEVTELCRSVLVLDRRHCGEDVQQ